MLALPNFTKRSIVEMDTCDRGMGVVLMQEEPPLAFISQALAPKHLGLSVYDKELLAVLAAVERWQHYLEGSPFVIKADHESLQFLSQQRLHMQLQRKGVSKLMGLDFTIQYRKGKENVVADALLRRDEMGNCHAISVALPAWI